MIRCSRAELDDACAAVEQTLADTDVAALSYRAVAIKHADWGIAGQGYAALVLEPSSQVLDFQAALLAAVTPFVGSGGTAAAFVTDPGEEITQSTLDWVSGFVPAQIGQGKYIPSHHRRLRHARRPETDRGRAIRRIPGASGRPRCTTSATTALLERRSRPGR